MEPRDKFIGVNSIKFYQRFVSDDECYKYLAGIKWENGYVCRKCGHTHYCKGEKPYSRRCTRCKYDESPTTGTMFDKLKFSLLIAFHIAFKISTKKKGMSSLELSEEYELRQKTCWAFKWKIQQAMKSSCQYPLKGQVHVDEFYVGGEEEQKRGRSKGKKKLVQDVITDEWNGYLPIKADFPKLTQRKSNDGSNFPDMHIHIMNIKGWLRGIHHHCSKEQLQGYLDEYHFRYNRRSNMDTIFDVLIRRMVCSQPIRLQNNKLDGAV